MSDTRDYSKLFPSLKIKDLKEEKNSIGTEEKVTAGKIKTGEELSSDKNDNDRQSLDSFSDSLLFGTPRADQETAIGIIGKIGEKRVAIDLQYPKSIAIYGKPGSGKSYLAGVLTEMLPTQTKNISCFPSDPSAVIVFNFRMEANARFEYGSYTETNNNAEENESLKSLYESIPQAIDPDRIQVFAHKSMKRRRSETDYRGLKVNNLCFQPSKLRAEDWLLLMGQPDSKTIYIKQITQILEELFEEDDLTISNLERAIQNSTMRTESKKLAEIRLDFAKKHLSEEDGINWGDVITPGTISILDFRKAFMTPQDALRLVLIAFGGVGLVSRDVNKFVLFDEFHEYYDEMFSDQLDLYRRMVRHNRLTLCIATQNAERIDKKVLESFTNKLIFNVESPTWVKLCDADPELKKIEFAKISNLLKESGDCYIKFDDCVDPAYKNTPLRISIRPRLTNHGGGTGV
jgi:hypothetical protein